MRSRYLALVRSSDDADRPLAAQICAAAGVRPGLHVALNRGPTVLVTAGERPLPLSSSSAIVGSVFENGEARPVRALEPDAQQQIVASGGDQLIERYWGAYVAILFDERRAETTIVRAPFGELPCLFVEVGDSLVMASDVAMLRSLVPYQPAIAWEAMCRHLAVRDIRHSETCLAGVRELHGGERLCIGRTRSIDAAWSPWRFAKREAQIDCGDEASDRVRAAVLTSVAARASEFGHVVLMLSGGLDSSVVAASLARARGSFDCLTLLTRDASGDERDYAQMTCQAVRHRLKVALREVSRIDVGRSAAAGLPRPNARAFAQESARAASEAAAEAGGGAIFTGGGGDNVFCSLQSGAPAADRMITSGIGRGFLRTAADVSEIASVSLLAVCNDAIKRAWLGKRGASRPCDGYLLSSRAVDAAARAPIHPWLDSPSNILPGKAAHVRLLAFAQSYVESFDPRDDFPMVAPLLAQPVVESCLRVPSWLWFKGERNRSIVRRAFAADLPAAIIERRSKGSPESFVAEIFDHHRTRIAELLLDGMLAENGVIDRAAVARALADPRPAHGKAFRRILELTDAESWARSQVAGC
jgi:asparagine synthase (glutamine-hydrolysing)